MHIDYEDLMKRGVPNHEKTVHLQALLDIRKSHAVGILQMLWFYAARFTPRGDIGARSNVEIAIGCDWPHTDADRLIDALTTAHWLDADDKHRLVVHDWAEECDRAVHAWLARRCLVFICGTVPESSSLSKAERKRIARKQAQGQLPGMPQDDWEARHDLFYKNYPRKANPARSRKAYKQHITTPEIHKELMDSVEAHKLYWRRTQRPLDKIPHPSSFINAESWKSELPQGAHDTLPEDGSPAFDPSALAPALEVSENTARLALGLPVEP